MPKNRSASLRTKARILASVENISYAEALRRLTAARTGGGAEPAVSDSETNCWLRSIQPGGLHKTTVEAPFGFAEFAANAKGWPPRRKNIPTGALLAELLTISDIVIDTDPAASDVTNAGAHTDERSTR